MSNLYIVATPIGNLEDITLRALRVLKEVDLILCEDTRVTKRLLAKYDIATPTLSCHQHSVDGKIVRIVKLLEGGKDIALVTDAGTPGISDPGNELIAHLVLQNTDLKIIPIPGPSAVTAALSISGFPTNEFLFLGFLPHKKGRQTMLQEVATSKRTVVLYESSHRILKLLQQCIDADLGNRHIVVAREVTKLFESIYRGTAAEVLTQLQSDAKRQKGEFVVVVSR